MSASPHTLLLPPSLTSMFSLARLLAGDPSHSARTAHAWLEQFEVSGPERRFVLALLRAKTNYWLFRCNQTRFCGDFIVVDMSGDSPSQRRLWVLELKANEAVREVGGHQVARWREAVAEIAQVHGVVEVGAEATLLRGGEDEVLAWLGVSRP